MSREPSLRKAAVLIASLDADTADLLLAQMSDVQSEQVRHELVELGELDQSEQHAVLDEFFRLGPQVLQVAPPVASDSPALKRPRPRLEDCIEELHSPSFGALSGAPPETLLALLEREHPQAIALVLSHVPPDRAGHVLARLAAGTQTEVIRRLVELDRTDPQVLCEVERAVATRLENERLNRTTTAGMASVTAILHASQPAARRQILSNLAVHDRHLAHRITPATPARRFTFAQVCQLPFQSFASLIQAVERRTAVLALAGAPPQLVEELLECLSPDEADWFSRRLTNLGPLRLTDIDRAQDDIAALAGQLANEGRLAGYSDVHLTAVV